MSSHGTTDDHTIVTIHADQCTCLVDEEFQGLLRERLQRAGPADWPELAEIKRSTVRTILAGTLDAGQGQRLAVHVKLFRAVRLSDRARDALSGARGVRELENLREARRRGLPCPRPIAAGRVDGSLGSRSFLITGTIPGASPLPPQGLPAAVAAAAGALLRRAHDAGLHARDLHPGNLVADADGRLWLLDLHSARFANPLDEDERARALAFFCLALDGNVDDSAARPLVEAYGARPELRQRAVRLGRRLRNRALSAFGRRATRDCRHTEVRTTDDGARWFLCRQSTALHAAALSWPAGAGAARPLKSGRRGAVFLDDRLCVKQREAGAARRLFRAAYWLAFAGVPTPRPVALRLGRGTGLVFTERMPQPTLLDELRNGRLETGMLVEAARQLGRAVGRMHAFGLRNRDMKLENLLRDAVDNRVYMLDLDGVRRKVPLDTRGQAADLGRLLAAYRHAADPLDSRVVRAFLLSYHRARRCLLLNRAPNLLELSEARSREWAATHPSTATR